MCALSGNILDLFNGDYLGRLVPRNCNSLIMKDTGATLDDTTCRYYHIGQTWLPSYSVG
jgi:hypothetical protein